MRFTPILPFLVLVSSCGSEEAAEEPAESATQCCSVTVSATVPEGTGTKSSSPWAAGTVRLSTSTARFRRITLYPRMVTQEVSHEIVSFKKDPEEYFADWEAAGILGTLVYWPDFESGIVSEAVISGG